MINSIDLLLRYEAQTGASPTISRMWEARDHTKKCPCCFLSFQTAADIAHCPTGEHVKFHILEETMLWSK